MVEEDRKYEKEVKGQGRQGDKAQHASNWSSRRGREKKGQCQYPKR